MLVISQALYDQMVTHLESCLPLEGCGLLGGRVAGEGTIEVQSIWPVSNVSPHPDSRYLMHPAGQVRAMLALDGQGQALAAIFHSHPNGPPTPSPTDIAEANYPNSACLIGVPQSGGWQVRAFDLAGQMAREIPLSIVTSC